MYNCAFVYWKWSTCKLIEAFSKGMPAISTTIGAEGLEYTDGKSILIADNSEMFADKIVSMKKWNLEINR